MRIRSIFNHSAQAIAEGALVALLVVGLMAGTAFAAKPVNNSGSGSGKCSASPNPVALGADYTLTGTGLGAGALVNVLIGDSMGTTSWNLQADANGTASVTWHSYAVGTSKVTFQQNRRHGFTTVATCSFTVN
jgi:hypothetical protein